MKLIMGDSSRNLEYYSNLHAQDTIIVCGCGHSLKTFKPQENVITIGVNDIGRLFTPDYLVVLNPPSQFKGERYRYVKSSKAKAIFTQLNLDFSHEIIVRFALGQRGGKEIGEDLCVPYTRNSPYVALCLAMFMGAKRIGLIGVDFTDHHFFSDTGSHPLTKTFHKIDKEYTQLREVANRKGIEIVNLSSESRLTAFVKMNMSDFLHKRREIREVAPSVRPQSSKKLNIVSYATTPVAGVPEILARCIRHYSSHNCHCVWYSNRYGNGVSFNSALEWKQNPASAKRLLAEADVVIVHNGKVAREHEPLLQHKPVVTMAHNYLWNVDTQFVQRGLPGVVVAQYQAVLPEFKGWKPIANPIPDWDEQHQPGNKNTLITICYTPSGKHNSYPANHRYYWHGKGYESTMAVLKKLASIYPLKLNVIRENQLSHSQVLQMKRESHIVIDECVTGSYHRNSLEGLACGAVVINGMNAAVENVFRQCSVNPHANSPFVISTLAQLETTLVNLIALGSEELCQMGMENRQWLETNWGFGWQWKQQWLPVLDEAIDQSNAAEMKAITRRKPASSSKPRHQRAVASVSSAKPRAVGALPVYWTCRTGRRGNFGDMLSPIVTKALSGQPAVFKQSSPRLFAVGSLLKFAKAGDIVWGAGFIDANDRTQKGIHVHAVRGPLTRERLLQQGIECPEVYGDPALLLPAIYDKPVTKKYAIGVIPHYVDMATVRSRLPANRKPSVCVIDIRAGVDAVIKLVRQCDVVLSSSLHGIVLAEAYGIPAAWLDISDMVVGGGFKFRDYYASTGRNPEPVSWRESIVLNDAVQTAIDIPAPILDLQKLVDAFPYHTHSRFSAISIPGKVIPDKPSVLQLQLTQTPPAIASKKTKPTGMAQQGSGRISVYGAATENYVEFMVASLRSFMQHNGHERFDYFILGNNFSARTQRLMLKYKIHYINVNLRNEFSRNLRHRYPGECFWIFKGPDIFHTMGYPYSLAIDGDILCKRKLVLDWLAEVQHVAGVHRGCSNRDFLKNIHQLEPLKRKIGLCEAHALGPATNSGVLFFNNANLACLGFYKRAVDAYRRSENAGILRGGDDSTLALILSLNPDLQLTVLPDSWNVYRGLNDWEIPSTLVEEANIIHLSIMKPWQSHRRYPNETVRHLIEEWRVFWPNSKVKRRVNLGKHDTEKLHARGAKLTVVPHKLPMDLYWYRGSQFNMGDEIAPWLIAKMLDIELANLPAKPVEPARSKRDVLISVGSVMRLSAPNAFIWGAGIRNIDQSVAQAKQFCAVRGPITRRRLLQLGYRCPEVYGDPAILLPSYYQPNIVKKYALGIIPHAVDYSAIKKQFSHLHNTLIIDVRTNRIESIINQINACEAILSSSLHGIILAVGYGIPVRWLKVSDRIMGDDCKFYDFFASLESSILDDFNFSKVMLMAEEKWKKYTPLYIENRQQGMPLNLTDLIGETHSIQNTLDVNCLQNAFPYERFKHYKLSA